MAATANDIWEFRATNGTANGGGGFAWLSLVNATYRWTLSGSGTNEYYCELAAGGDPSLPGQTGMSVTTDGTYTEDTEGTVGSLNIGEWDWADNDSLGFSTVYVRLDGELDPDIKNFGFVQMGLTGGKDYTQQDAAQLQLTDLATSGIGVTTLTSVTGGFTALMIDNYIQIRNGTNVTAGFYRVTARTDTNTVTLDRAPDDGGGGISGGSGDLGGALDILTDGFIDDTNTLLAGNTIFVKNELMTLTGAISGAKDGTLLAPITLAGYNTTRGDNPVGANRPTIAAGANSTSFDDFWVVKNFIITTTTTGGLDIDLSNEINNVKVTNSSVSGSRECYTFPSRLVGCEGISDNGNVATLVTNSRIFACYFHDSTTAIVMIAGSGIIVSGCVLDSCVEGISATTAADKHLIINNTFYNNTTAINYGATNDSMFIANNIFVGNTNDILWGDADRSMFLDYNVTDNEGGITGGLIHGPNTIIGDPGLTDPDNGDFTLGSGSNAIGAALDVSNSGPTGDYKWNIGVDQDDVAAVGGNVIIQRPRRVM